MTTRHVKIGMNRYKIGIWVECPNVEGSKCFYESFYRDSWWFWQSTPNKKDMSNIRERLSDYLLGLYHEDFDTLCIYIPDPKVRRSIQSEFNRFKSRIELGAWSEFHLETLMRKYRTNYPDGMLEMDANFPDLVIVDEAQYEFPKSGYSVRA